MRLGFLNVQSGVGVTRGLWQYVLRGHRYLVPHDARIVDALADFARRERLDVLACVEVDGASWRSGGHDYAGELARVSPLVHAAFFTMTQLGRWLHQGNAVVSAPPIVTQASWALPGGRQQRVLGDVELGTTPPLHVLVTHLSLGRRARAQQLARIADIVRGRRRVVLVGDFNTDDPVETTPLEQARLRRVATAPTQPSWRPRAAIDQLWCSPELQVRSVAVPPLYVSDHLPIVAELT